jgi:glycosyltransferase involved in cell wall biosynthesis
MVGDGPERSRLEALARAEGVDAEFVGWVSAERRDELLSQSDLLLFPSTWPEPFGLAGVEAARLGVPAAGFATGGVLDWLLPGVSGELAPANPCRSDAFADAICRALATPDHWAALCRGAQETSRNFTIADHLGRLEGVLARAAAGAPCAPA